MIIMTKKIYTLLFLAAASLAMVSCEKKGTDQPTENGYYFAVSSQDEYDNVSELSNEVYAKNVQTAGAVATSGANVFAPNTRGSVKAQAPRYAQNKAMYQATSSAKQGIVNIKFKPSMRQTIQSGALSGVARGSVRSAAKTGLEGVDRAAVALGGNVTFERVFPYVAKNEAKAQRHGLDLWYEVRFDESAVPLSRAIAAFDNLGEIEIVETVKRTVINDGSKDVKPVIIKADGVIDHATKAGALPFNDPLLVKQWHYDRDVQNQVVAPTGHINLLRAWNKTAGSNKVIVAIIDEGLDVNHEDLKDAMWVNKGEIPGNNIDDDGNGFVDDINGWNFCNLSGDLGLPGKNHGCHVGGTVGATNNNGKGVCGVAGGTGNGDGVRLMSCDVHSAPRGENLEANAFRYAADNGAIIAQCSWGFVDVNQTSKAIEDAIDYFIAEAGNATDFPDSPMRGGIVFFASGNSSSTLGLYYPGAYPQVIAVTATNIRGDRPKYANVDTWVDIAAPGGADLNVDPAGALIVSCMRDNQYGGMPGTSMATPHVAGVAALLVGVNPGITPEKLKDLILTSGKSINETAPEYVGKMGVGCINASKHLSVDKKDAPSKITNLDFKFQKGYKIDWTVPVDPSNDEIKGFTLYYDIKPITEETKATAKQMKVDTVMVPGTVFTLEVDKIPGIKINANM